MSAHRGLAGSASDPAEKPQPKHLANCRGHLALGYGEDRACREGRSRGPGGHMPHYKGAPAAQFLLILQLGLQVQLG